MTEATSHGTEVGRSFSFVEVERMGVGGPSTTPRGWLKTTAAHQEQAKRVLVRGKWIYAFRVGNVGRAQLFAEFAIDAGGKIRALPGDKRLKAEPDGCPDGMSLDGPYVYLPITVNNAPSYWFFVVSRIRLACASLRELCRFQVASPEFDGFVFAIRNSVSLPVLDIAKDTSFVEPAEGARPALPVIDFLSIAYGLHADFERAREHYARYVMAADDASDTERKQVLSRAMKYSLARVLHEMFQSQPSLAGKTKGGHGATVVDYLHDFEKTIGRLKTERERAARALCRLLRSPLLELVESWYRERETDTYDQWLEHLARFHDRLDESAIGLAHLHAPTAIVAHALEHYLFPKSALAESPEAKKYVSTGKKVLGAVTNLWTKYLPWRLVPPEIAKEVQVAHLNRKETIAWMNRLLGDEVFVLHPPTNQKSTKYQRYDLKQMAVAALKPQDFTLAERDMERATARVKKAEKALKEAQEAVKKRIWADAGTNLQLCADALNNLFKLSAIVNKSADKRSWWDAADGTGAINSVLRNHVWEKLKAGEGLGKTIGTRAVRIAGGIGALLDAALTVRDISDAMDDDDLAAALATGASGAAAIATGFLTLFAVTAPPLALAMAVVQAGAAFLAFAWRDERIENFVEHCAFGEAFGTSGATPKWSDGSYASWAEGYEGLCRQINTLYNLITTFRVRMYNPGSITVTLGYYDEDMTLVARYWDDQTPTGRPVEVNVKLATGESTITGSGPESAPITVAAEGHVVDGRIDKLRINFDSKWRGHVRANAFCVLSIHRNTDIAGQNVATIIPRHPVGLDDDERRFYGRRDGVDPPVEGLTFPLFGPGGYNFQEKSSG